MHTVPSYSQQLHTSAWQSPCTLVCRWALPPPSRRTESPRCWCQSQHDCSVSAERRADSMNWQTASDGRATAAPVYSAARPPNDQDDDRSDQNGASAGNHLSTTNVCSVNAVNSSTEKQSTKLPLSVVYCYQRGSVAKMLACRTQAQKGTGSNSRDAVG